MLAYFPKTKDISAKACHKARRRRLLPTLEASATLTQMGGIQKRSTDFGSQALRANPFAPQVPCHRVIASDLTLGGFKGHTSGQALAEKLRLLATEGIIFENGRLSDPRRALR